MPAFLMQIPRTIAPAPSRTVRPATGIAAVWLLGAVQLLTPAAGCSAPEVPPTSPVALATSGPPPCEDTWYYDQDGVTRLPLPDTAATTPPVDVILRLREGREIGSVVFSEYVGCVLNGPVPGTWLVTTPNAICDANRLVESGAVVWAQPNFSRRYELRESEIAP